MRLCCFYCGKPVSTEIPNHTVLRGTCICPECADATKWCPICGKTYDSCKNCDSIIATLPDTEERNDV